jgi:hypothetical protein
LSFHSDLYGAIGYPLKLARTVVIGKNSKLVGQMLRILSYFIRCTEVFEHTPQRVELQEESYTHHSDLETENCCLCRQNDDTINELEQSHKHNICNSCIEKSGLSICTNCQKLVPKDLDECILSQPAELSRKLLHGLPCCPDCGLLQKNGTLEEIIRVNSMSGSCGCLPKWAAAKELQHFLTDINYSERSETFKCYCCEEKEESKEFSTELKSTFKCYCIGEDRCSHCTSRKNGLNTNSPNIYDLVNGQTNEMMLETIFLQLLSHDQFCSKLECKCLTSKDNNSCLELDLEACQDSLEKNEVESNDSCGPSCSLDSGFHQTSTCCAKNKVELECLSLDTLEDEDEFGPEELPLPGCV